MKNASTRILAILLAVLMLFGMAACSKSGSKESPGAPGGSTQPEQVPGQTSGESENAETDGSMESDMLAEDQTLGYYVGNDPGTIDPWVNNSGSASTIIAAVNEPMFRYADNEQGYEPGIMTDYMASEDNTVHTLTLREGVKWEDGTEITMDDVTNSILRAIDPELGSSIAYRYFIIKNASEYFSGEASVEDVGVKALNAHTLEITTAEPCDYFLDLLTSDAMAPIQKMAADKYGELYGTDAEKIVASGPFRVSAWTSQNSIVLEKNENYWDADNVALQTINITITTDANTILGMYQTGELSLYNVPNDQLAQYAGDPTLVTNKLLRNTFIEFNPANEFLGNINIREAFSIAFNRQIFAEQVMGDASLAAYGLVPYGVRGLAGGDFREQAGPIVTDASDSTAIAHAQELLQMGLDELGKTVADLQQGFSIQCLERGKIQAQAIQAMWKTNLGVEMPVSVLEFNVILPMLMDGTFDCVIGGGQDSNYRDPQGFMQFIYDEGKWDNEEFLSLVEKAHMQTGDERIQTWMDVEKMVLDNFIYIPQVYAENHWVTQTGIRGLMIKNYGYEFDFKHVWIAK